MAQEESRHRVLIVDDEEAIRLLLAHILSKELQLDAATPVLVVSVLADELTVAGCIAAGADAHHAKPIRRPELVATVKTLITKRTHG